MTQRTEIERVLDIWLADGPGRVPDRVFDDAIARLYREPAPRAWRLPWRNTTVSMPLRLAVAAIAIVAIAGIGLNLYLNPSVGPVPTQSTGPDTSPAPATSQAAPSATLQAAGCERGVLPDGQTVPFECLGPLAAGTYTTTNLVVPLTYTVPDGWTNTVDIDGGYIIGRPGNATAGVPPAVIFVWLDPLVADQAACEIQPDPSVGSSVADLVQFLHSSSMLTATDRGSVTFGEASGQALDVEVAAPAGTLEPCRDRVQLYVHGWTGEDGFWWSASHGDLARHVLLSGAGGHTILIDVEARAFNFDDVIALTQPVIDSFRFARVATTPVFGLCPTTNPACTGRLAPGTHRTDQLLTPVAYTTPWDWSKRLDVPGALNLKPTGSRDADFLAIWPDWQVASQTACSDRPEPGLGRTVDDLIGFLQGHPGLVAGEPTPVAIGGLSGQAIEIRRAPGWTGPCPNAVSLFTHTGTVNDVGWIEIAGDMVMRMWFLDAPDGHVINIAIQGETQESFDALVTEAEEIVLSLDFSS